MRKLASIRRVGALLPIEGADRIEVAVIDGWKVVVQKGSYKVDDRVVYFEIDSFLPVDARYEFLRKTSYRSTAHLGDGFRIKTIKLRGQVSQGLCVPVGEFPEFDVARLSDGDDVTELLGVKLWKPGPTRFSGNAKGSFPHFISKTDQERAQNLAREIPALAEEVFEVTAKLDGSSMTVYLDEEGNIGVCSRNLDLKDEPDSVLWSVARSSGVIALLQDFGQPLAIQGELVGPGIQKNAENLPAHAFYVFDVWNILLREYLLPSHRRALIGDRLKHVPVLHESLLLGSVLSSGDVVADLMSLAESPREMGKEGVVFKSTTRDYSFKVIANSYLLAED